MELLGIVASKTLNAEVGAWNARSELEAVDNLKNDLRRLYKRDDLILEGCKIQQLAQITNAAGKGLAYLETSNDGAAGAARSMFATLGAEVRKRAPGRKR